jgi:hypothetical protein
MISANTVRIAEGLALVTPPGRRLSRPVVDSIESALERLDIGDLTGARALMRDLEERLGVTEHQRVAAAAGGEAGPFLLAGKGAGIHGAILAKRTARNTAERDRAVALIPRDVPPLTDADRFALQMVDQKLAEVQIHKEVGNRRLAKLRVADARRILMLLEQSRFGRHEARWAARVLCEIEALEIAFGGTVERRPLNGGNPIQLSSRDGLYTLAQAYSVKGVALPPRLNRTQLGAGLAYRTLYEKTDPERSLKPKSMDPADETVGRGGEGWAEKRAALWDTRKKIDERVKAAAGERGLQMLQEVAGKGRCVAHVASGGKSRDLATARLIKALDEAAFAFGF